MIPSDEGRSRRGWIGGLSDLVIAGRTLRTALALTLAGAALLPGLGACVDQPAPAARSSKVVLPNLSGPTRSPARRRAASRPRAATSPASWIQISRPGTVAAARVEQRLGSTTQTILDLRPAEQFRRGHLPGSRNDPEGRGLLAALRARRRAAAGPTPTTRRPSPPDRTVVLVHGGRNLRDQAVAARAYLVLYAGGADPGRLAMLRGGYVSWRRQRRPQTTAQTNKTPLRPRLRSRRRPTSTPPTPVPAPKRRAGVVSRSRPRPQVLLTDPAALTTALGRPRTVLVHTGLHRPAKTKSRTNPAWLRFGVAPLQPAPGALPHTSTELRKHFAPLLASGGKVRLIAFGDQGLWASLVWFTLKTRLHRSDALNTVYLGPMFIPRSPPARPNALRR